MPLQQGVVWASWKSDKKCWEALVGDETVQSSLHGIVSKLGSNGWEIVSVVPSSTETSVGLNPYGTGGVNVSSVSSYAIFIKKQA